MYDIQKKECENIKALFDFIQLKASEDLAYLFRINFLKIDEIDADYISIITNTFMKIENSLIVELKNIIDIFGFKNKVYI
jgi:hypothetical protein